MFRSPSKLVCSTALAVLLAGCAGYPVETDYDPAVDFAGLRTYRWLAVERPRTGDPRLDSDLLDGRVRRAVDTALATRGYTRVDGEGADFEVTYHVGVDKQVDVQTYVDSYPRGYRWYPGPSQTYTTVREYEVGSLVLDILSPASKQLIWRGATQARVTDDGTPQEREQRAHDAVGAILAKFPPPPAQPPRAPQ